MLWFIFFTILLTLAMFVALLYQAAALTADQEFIAQQRPTDLETYPMVSIIVPARNEARNIHDCLQSLLQFDYPHYEILVADDGSTDQTVAIVDALRQVDGTGKIRLLSQTDWDMPRDEWVSGKSYVLWNASRQAQGEWVLFVDADTRHRPDGLWRALAFVRQHQLRALSCSGIYPNPSFWGEVLEGLIYIAVFLSIPLRQVNDSAQAVGWMNGQFILVERQSYDQIEGHYAIREYAQDDLAMGRYLKKRQVPYRFMPAAQLFTCINYITFKESFRGWARLLAGGTAWIGIGKRYLLVSMLVLALTGLLPSLLFPFLGTLETRFFGLSASFLCLAQIGLATLLCALNRASMKISIWRAILLPLAAFLVLGVYMEGYRLRFGKGKYVLRGRVLQTDQIF